MLELIFTLLDIYKWVIIAAALITWVSPDPRNPIVTILRQVTEPVLAPARRLLPMYRFTMTAMTAFQPKLLTIVMMSRPHLSATMRTGGAA